MSIATEITRLQTAKADLKTAIEGKGVTVPSSATLDDYADLVDSISGGGGDYTAADFADASKPTGAVIFDEVTMPADSAYFAKRTGITSIFGTNYNETGNRTGMFRDMTGLKYAVFPALTKAYNSFLYNCTNLEAVDWLGGSTGGSLIWANCTKLNVMVIRKTDGACSLSASNALNGTLFASDKSGGTLYVPSALISSYQSASNWSTYLSYPNNSIQAIETSPYKNYYVDGTPIS